MKYNRFMAKSLKMPGKSALKSAARKTEASQDRLKRGIRRTSTDSYGGAPLIKPDQAQQRGAAGARDPFVLELVRTQHALLGEVKSLRRQLSQNNLRIAQQGRMLSALIGERPVAVAEPAVPPEAPNRASDALAGMRARLGITPETASTALAAQAQVSETVKAGWIEDGLLVGSTVLAEAWGCSRQALEQACERGELFNLKIGNRRYYPASFLGLSAEDVGEVCTLLQGLEPTAKFIFWERKQGMLGGHSLAEVLVQGRTADAVRAAEAAVNEQAPLVHAAAA